MTPPSTPRGIKRIRSAIARCSSQSLADGILRIVFLNDRTREIFFQNPTSYSFPTAGRKKELTKIGSAKKKRTCRYILNKRFIDSIVKYVILMSNEIILL